MAGQSLEKRHGHARTALYDVWVTIKSRCFNQNYKGYENYGARGITMCSSWREDYVEFHDWAMANGYKRGLEIDREDNDGSYEPGNCRWVTRRTNTQNTRRNRNVEAFGETKCVSEWSRDPRCEVSLVTLNTRLRRGWDFLAALTTPGVRQQDEQGKFIRPETVSDVEFVPYRK